jgi:hypothetical protein
MDMRATGRGTENLPAYLLCNANKTDRCRASAEGTEIPCLWYPIGAMEAPCNSNTEETSLCKKINNNRGSWATYTAKPASAATVPAGDEEGAQVLLITYCRLGHGRCPGLEAETSRRGARRAAPLRSGRSVAGLFRQLAFPPSKGRVIPIARGFSVFSGPRSPHCRATAPPTKPKTDVISVYTLVDPPALVRKHHPPSIG